ncbi:hypothetical protein [Schinkia azotoformans]|uniref:hypothetical protein n=1 Tax=Schinkia azotoformans TaxID=1454 RepID=UPI002DBCA65C|nr:hypothetical protein [Schinkia azotoformans]MEC1697780.1 hypothetical protein [Schinkia azotoformans]
MKEVKVLFDLESGIVEQQAFLIDENNVIYLDDFDNSIYLQGVEPTEKEGVYKEDESGFIILGSYDKSIEDQENEVKRIVNVMKDISLYDFIINHLDRSIACDELNINQL